MRASRLLLAVLILAGVCLNGRLPARAGGWPAQLFAPYADFTAWPPYDLMGAATNSGLRYATLAFIVADPSQNAATAPVTNLPTWGGFTAYSAASGYRVGDISAFRALGGDVVVSFGGEAGTELAVYVTDTNRLKTAYQFVINTYRTTRIDFDIEGSWVADVPSINRRSAVLAALQADAVAAGRTLEISLTLPVLPSGLDNNGLYAVQSAVSHHVTLATVNIMAMDYGDNAAPNPAGHMGDYAIMAATNLFNQLKSVYTAANISKTDAQLWQMIGVTPMLGVNDAQDEIFDQPAAAKLVSYAETKNFGELAFWSLNRDQPGSSGIAQTAFQFTESFLPFGGGVAPAPVILPANSGVIAPATGMTSLIFPVTLSTTSTSAVSVAYFTSDGSATAPGDYKATNGTLAFAPGQTAGTITVMVPGTTNVGPNKYFYLNLTNATGANLFSPQVTGAITNNNSSGGGGGQTNGSGTGGECAITSQWLVTYDSGAAFQAIQTLNNPNRTNITLTSFAFNAAFTNIDWIDAGSMSGWVKPAHSGNQFTISSGWPVPAVTPAGGSLQLTYQGEPGGSPPAPANLVINGVTVENCGNGMPVYFTSVARNGNNIALAWKTPGGSTNWVQAAGTGLSGWTNLCGPLLITGSGSVSTNWTDTGATTNGRARFYRVLVNY